MPTLSASDYTNYVKAQAASLAYRNGAVPVPIQRVSQPYATQSVLNAQLLASQAAYVVNAPVTVVSTANTTVTDVSATTLTAASSDGTNVTYTSSVAHGLVVGSVVSISGFATATSLNLTNQVVIASGLTSTQFKVANTVAATSESGSTTGRINGYVYYTTAAAHGIFANARNISITGLATAAFNLTLATVALVPSSTVFAIATTATGTARTSQSGVITATSYQNSTGVMTNIARVRPFVGVGYVNQPKSLSTIGRSDTLSSGKFPQLGGLPLTGAKSDGVYAPVAHLARVDTKATGAYKSVRQPV
jgi:hypothetical protein